MSFTYKNRSKATKFFNEVIKKIKGVLVDCPHSIWKLDQLHFKLVKVLKKCQLIIHLHGTILLIRDDTYCIIGLSIFYTFIVGRYIIKYLGLVQFCRETENKKSITTHDHSQNVCIPFGLEQINYAHLYEYWTRCAIKAADLIIVILN